MTITRARCRAAVLTGPFAYKLYFLTRYDPISSDLERNCVRFSTVMQHWKRKYPASDDIRLFQVIFALPTSGMLLMHHSRKSLILI